MQHRSISTNKDHRLTSSSSIEAAHKTYHPKVKRRLRRAKNLFSFLFSLLPQNQMSASGGHNEQASTSSQNLFTAFVAATLYVISGSTQPLLMTLVKESGLGDPMCQLYMLFYYLGPALVSFTLCIPSSSSRSVPSVTSSTLSVSSSSSPSSSISPSVQSSNNNNNNNNNSVWPKRHILIKSAGIASIDIVAQAMNYTGSTFCGPTIFAIIYSSVTIWTALYSRIILARTLNTTQWIGVFIVFAGLSITAWDSAALGSQVLRGALLVFMGSSLHAMTYVLSEAIMTKRTAANGRTHHDSTNDHLSVTTNCAIQGLVALFVYITWQCVYTLPRFQERIVLPAQQSGTSLTTALLILSSLGGSNLVHALTFFYTLKCFPGGATSAGVMKGLQAVLVFVFTSVVYCGRSGEDGEGEGEEMCFTRIKFISLVVVVGGVLIFAIGTDLGRQRYVNDAGNTSGGCGWERRSRRNYAPIGIEEHTILPMSPV